MRNGARGITFDIGKAFSDMRLTLPCGRCIGCRLERSRQWAMRCVHESELYDKNCFITLTYNPDNLPVDGSLDVSMFQKFMKRLRKRYEVLDDDGKLVPGTGIRFFHCGEYGAELSRSHYHAILFNHDFEDKKYMSTKNGNRLYRSAILEELWPYGFCTVGDVTFESAAYVARYICKKINGPKAESHYGSKAPEYATMSRRPGIGMRWIENFGREVYRDDFVVFRGQKMKPPKAYDKAFGHEGFIGPLTREAYMRRCILRYAKFRREEAAEADEFDATPKRLMVREAVKLSRITNLSREFEREA